MAVICRSRSRFRDAGKTAGQTSGGVLASQAQPLLVVNNTIIERTVFMILKTPKQHERYLGTRGKASLEHAL
jgi:hypothetical protein